MKHLSLIILIQFCVSNIEIFGQGSKHNTKNSPHELKEKYSNEIKKENIAFIRQAEGAYNVAIINQSSGVGNVAKVTQVGSNNSAEIIQKGNRNIADASVIKGNTNNVFVMQSGRENVAEGKQSGNGLGDKSQVTVLQRGKGNKADYSQESGTPGFTIIQKGNNANVQVRQGRSRGLY